MSESKNSKKPAKPRKKYGRKDYQAGQRIMVAVVEERLERLAELMDELRLTDDQVMLIQRLVLPEQYGGIRL